MQGISSNGILPRNVHATQEFRDTKWFETSSMVSFALIGVVIKVRDATANS